MGTSKGAFTPGLIFAAAVLIAGCSDDSDGPAMVEGMVGGGAGFGSPSVSLLSSPAGIEGATVILARSNSAGELDTVSDGSVETQADGSFRVSTGLDGETGLVVVATQGNATWMSVVSAAVRRGETVPCQPLNVETTVEAEVHASLMEQNMAGEVSKADVAASVDTDLAGAIETDAGSAGEVAVALGAMTDAQTTALMHSRIGLNSGGIDELVTLRSRVVTRLEADLNAAGENDAATEAALESFVSDDLDAFVEVGVSPQQTALARCIAVRSALRNSNSLDAATEFEFQRSLALMRAHAVGRASLEIMSDLDAGNTEMTITSAANAALLTSLRAATSDANIQAAFDNHHDSVVNALRGAVEDGETMITVLDASVAATVIDLKSDLEAAVGIGGLVDAHFDFESAVAAIVDAGLSGGSEAERQGVTDALVLLNLPA